MAKVQLFYRDGTPSGDAPVSFEDFTSGSNASAVRIEPGEDARALLPQLEQLALVEVSFPKFGDGRNYSSAQILRENGYQGEIRATGEVLVDQIVAMRRSGIDSFAPDEPLNETDVENALKRYPNIYQKTSGATQDNNNARTPIWALRHSS